MEEHFQDLKDESLKSESQELDEENGSGREDSEEKKDFEEPGAELGSIGNFFWEIYLFVYMIIWYNYYTPYIF